MQLLISLQFTIICPYTFQLKKGMNIQLSTSSAADQQFLGFIMPVIMQEKAQM